MEWRSWPADDRILGYARPESIQEQRCDWLVASWSIVLSVLHTDEEELVIKQERPNALLG